MCSSDEASRSSSRRRSRRASSMLRSIVISGTVSEQLVSEQLREMPLNSAVALARGGLQARSVENGHVAILVTDQASLLQGAGGDGHAGPADAQHHRHELVRHRKLIGSGAVMRHEHPASQALFKGMVTIAHSGLRNLLVQRLHVTQQAGPQRVAFVERLPQGCWLDA